MHDIIVLVWVGFIFLAAIFFSSVSLVRLFQNGQIAFDKGFFLSLSACSLAVMLCLSVEPPLHRVYDDEPAYISQSVNILSAGKPNITIKGSRLQPELFASWTANNKLPGFAWIEAVVLFLTHDIDHSFFILNIILGALSVAVVYRIAWILSASHPVAWWAAIFMACLPARITYSMSGASDIAGSFLFLLFLLFICEYKTLQAKQILYAAVFCGLYSICVKQVYGVFVIPGLAAALYFYKQDGRLDNKSYQQILMDTICLFLPVLTAIPFMLFSDTKAGAFSLHFFFKNFFTSISYLFSYKQNTFLTTLAALIAVGRSIFFKKNNGVNGLAGWFLTGLLMVSLFCAGGLSYPGYAYSDRYILLFAFPFVFLAAQGIVDIKIAVRSRLWEPLFFLLLVISALFASDHLTHQTQNSFFYKKTLLLTRASAFIPDKAFILDKNAVLVTMISSKRSILPDLFLRGDQPQLVVYLTGIYEDSNHNPDDKYDDRKSRIMIENILSIKYQCKPLTAAPLKEAGLSTTPVLCTRKPD